MDISSCTDASFIESASKIAEASQCNGKESIILGLLIVTRPILLLGIFYPLFQSAFFFFFYLYPQKHLLDQMQLITF